MQSRKTPAVVVVAAVVPSRDMGSWPSQLSISSIVLFLPLIVPDFKLNKWKILLLLILQTYHSVILVAIADRKPCVLKLSSFAEHKARPLITGTNDRLTYRPVCSPAKKGIRRY